MTENVRAGLGSGLLFIAYDFRGNLTSPPQHCQHPSYPGPWPVLPGRGSRGILKSMTAENEGTCQQQSSTSWPVVNTSTQVNRVRMCTARAEAAPSVGSTTPSQAALENTLSKD